MVNTGLLFTGLVPADLPRVHVGGLRQVGPRYAKLSPVQADRFTQVHDPFNTSGERRRHRDRADRANGRFRTPRWPR